MDTEDFDLAGAFLALGSEAAPESKNTSEPEPSQPENATNPEGQATEQPEGEATEATDAEPQGEAEESADSEETATEEEAGDTPAAIPEGHVEVELDDGQKVIVPAVAKDAILRHVDYSRKTSELAEFRKTIETEAAQFKQHQLEVLSRLNSEYEQLNPIAQLEAARKAAESIGDTEEVNRLDIAIIKTSNKLNGLKQAEQQMRDEENQRKAVEIQQKLGAEMKLLEGKLPGFQDPAKREGYKKQIATGLQKLGFSDSDIANLGDHRAALAGYYAAKYFEMIDAKPQVAEALKGKAVNAKPGARTVTSGKDVKLSEAFRNFDKNPNAEGALAGIFRSL